MFTHISIDWGEKYIGIAYGDIKTGLIIAADHLVNSQNFLDVFREKLEKYDINHVIIGYPTNVKTQPTEVSDKITQFTAELSHRLPDLNITLVDERYSTKIAKSKLHRDVLREILNNQAAAEILQKYFDEEE